MGTAVNREHVVLQFAKMLHLIYRNVFISWKCFPPHLLSLCSSNTLMFQGVLLPARLGGGRSTQYHLKSWCTSECETQHRSPNHVGYPGEDLLFLKPPTLLVDVRSMEDSHGATSRKVGVSHRCHLTSFQLSSKSLIQIKMPKTESMCLKVGFPHHKCVLISFISTWKTILFLYQPNITRVKAKSSF